MAFVQCAHSGNEACFFALLFLLMNVVRKLFCFFENDHDRGLEQ